MSDPIPTIRAAAERLRELAAAAADAAKGDTWTARHRRSKSADLAAGPGWPLLHGPGHYGARPFVLPPVADHIAALDPAAGLLLAGLLERVADEADEAGHETCSSCTPAVCSLAAAVALAAKIDDNGESR